jgi:hypothetical protein
VSITQWALELYFLTQLPNGMMAGHEAKTAQAPQAIPATT